MAVIAIHTFWKFTLKYMHIYEFLAHYNLYLKKFMAKINFLNILIRLYKDKPQRKNDNAIQMKP